MNYLFKDIKLKIEKNKKSPNMSGFSLVELIVSMGVVAIVLLMLNTVIINSVIASQKSLARSTVREEISTIADLVAKDIRDADRIGACSGNLDNENLRCEIFGLRNVIWQLCDENGINHMCRIDANTLTPLYISTPILQLDQVSFDIGFGGGSVSTRKNIIFTLVGSHENENMNVNNVLRQTIITTRNYTLI